MTEEPARLIPDWLATDILIIVLAVAIIGLGIWIAP
jgi:hypothetical protein